LPAGEVESKNVLTIYSAERMRGLRNDVALQGVEYIREAPAVCRRTLSQIDDDALRCGKAHSVVVEVGGIRTFPAGYRIAAPTRPNLVVAITAIQRVVAVIPSELIATLAPRYSIVALEADQNVVVHSAGQRVVVDRSYNLRHLEAPRE
jgi:hypothetical protein